MSCNGCRVLRKGCSDTCVLRQCLRWIEHPDAQGHATVFVAKFFGRAGMMALVSSVPESQRPALFQSLLYEACGRTVNPVFGAVGLLCSGNWKICQEAVDTVMKGGLLSGSPASGTGRPFHSPATTTTTTPKLRLGRGFVNPGQPLLTQLTQVMKEEVAEEVEILNNNNNNNNMNINNNSSSSSRMKRKFAKGGDVLFKEEDKRMKVEMEEEGGGKVACGDEGPGLDLTLGSSLLSCSSSGGRKKSSSSAKLTRRRSETTSSNCRSRSSSQSEEADSDTTDLSISMIQRSKSSHSSRRELLLDLLH